MSKAVRVGTALLAIAAIAQISISARAQPPVSPTALQNSSVVLDAEPAFRAGLGAYQSGDYARAMRNWHPAALNGHPKARASLAYLYYTGLGVPRSERAAFTWYSMAAIQGEATSQYHLGRMFLKGVVVDRDASIAFMWCDLASNAGYPGASRCRDAAARELNESQMEGARERARLMFADRES